MNDISIHDNPLFIQKNSPLVYTRNFNDTWFD